jgi:hypothetical protein
MCCRFSFALPVVSPTPAAVGVPDQKSVPPELVSVSFTESSSSTSKKTSAKR